MRRLALVLASGALLASLPAIAQSDRVHRIGGFTPNSDEGMARRVDFRDAMLPIVLTGGFDPVGEIGRAHV